MASALRHCTNSPWPVELMPAPEARTATIMPRARSIAWMAAVLSGVADAAQPDASTPWLAPAWQATRIKVLIA